MRIFRISHCRRGGGHAVALWVYHHFDSAVFCNNVRSELRPNLQRGDGTDIVATFEDKVVPAECHVLRDVYNCMASRMALHDYRLELAPVHGYRTTSLQLWINFAKQDVQFTHFPRFVKCRAYRLAEAKRLNLPNALRDPSLAKDAGFGGGSSFDGVVGAACDRDLLTRHERIPHDRFAEILASKEAAALNMQHFGWMLDERGNMIIHANHSQCACCGSFAETKSDLCDQCHTCMDTTFVTDPTPDLDVKIYTRGKYA